MRSSADAAHVVEVNTTASLIAGANTVIPTGPILAGFGWKVIARNGPATELTPAAILCGANGQAIDPGSLVFFNQLTSTVAADTIQYVTGADQEQIDINLPAVPATVDRIIFTVFVNPDERTPGSFDAVRDPYVRIAGADGTEHARFDVPAPGVRVGAVNFGELYRHRGAWKFRALGDGYQGGVADVARTFGISL